ncbi:unnamed protein product, partial [Staurois parvus]
CPEHLTPPITSDVKNPTPSLTSPCTPFGGRAGKQKVQGLEEDQKRNAVIYQSVLNAETRGRRDEGVLQLHCTDRCIIWQRSSILLSAADC